jgi:hypothetical protein
VIYTKIGNHNKTEIGVFADLYKVQETQTLNIFRDICVEQSDYRKRSTLLTGNRVNTESNSGGLYCHATQYFCSSA